MPMSICVHMYICTYSNIQAECTQSGMSNNHNLYREYADHGLLQQLQYVFKTLCAEILWIEIEP